MIRFNMPSRQCGKRVEKLLRELGYRRPATSAAFEHPSNQYGPHNEPYYAMVFYNKDRPDITL